MLSYHGDPAIKAKYLTRVREHARLDHLVQGTGWDGGRGCAVGCTLDAYDHRRYPIELGLPEWLAHLEDRIFEELPWEDARTWPERFLNAIPVGADLEPVQWQQAIWRHERQLAALEGKEARYAQKACEAIQLVIDYCWAKLDGTATENQREKAYSAARSAVESAAYSAVYSAVYSATYSAGYSVAASEKWAAWEAEEVVKWAAEWGAKWAAEWAAESAVAELGQSAGYAHWHDEAENLLMLLANAKVSA
jgi:hypothetical protein